MESNNLDTTIASKNSLHTVTPFSKYAAMALFVALPFIGGYVGMQYAPVQEVFIDKVVTRESKIPEVKPDEYTWISYSRLLTWAPREKQFGAFQGSDGLGFSMLVPVTSELAPDLPTVNVESPGDAGAIAFRAKTGTSTSRVSAYVQTDDQTNYEDSKHAKHTNAQGLTYYQYVSDRPRPNPPAIVSFTGIDKANMTLQITISGLSEADTLKVLDSVAQTTRYDSGD